MARSDEPELEIWGTWEELLLACAVGRHGTRRWESVALEIQSRSPLPHLLTPQSCRQRYRDLQRRFSAAGAGAGAGEDDGGDADSTPEVPWLEELRKLRVAELRREVERYDLSIGSLQLKVKKLQEERERSIRESNSGDVKLDRVKEESRPSESTPEGVAGYRISGRDSGPSCEESTSTDPKKDERKPAETDDIGGKPADPSVVAGGGGGEGASPAAREGSCDGSTEGGAGSDPASRPQSGESVAESSKGEADGREKEEDGVVGNEGEKENSDVQSSASLSRQRQQRGRGRRWGKAVSGGSSSVGDDLEGDAEAEEVSGASHRHAAAISGPLVSFLGIVRSDKHGSVFDRRLEGQEGEEYRSLIRQHVDLEMVQSRIDRIGSGHPYAAVDFFRDLLLLCNNALVFYPKDAPESVSALHLRDLVSKRMATILTPPALRTAEAVPAVTLEAKTTASKPKLELDLPVSLLGKTSSSTPLIVCRKRSAISNKAAAATSLKEEEIVEEEEEDKPELDKKRKDNEEKLQAKKTTKDKPVLSGTTRGLRTSKSRGGHGGGVATGKRPGVAPAMNLKAKPVEAAMTAEAPRKADKKTVTPAASGTKKQNASSFLSRMKKNTNGSTTTITAAESVKNSSGGCSGKGSNQKKGGKGDNRKDKISRQGSVAAGGGSSTKKSEETSGGKRSVGRPPKRSAPPVTPPPSKRAREEAEPVAAAPSSRPPTSGSRKRGRR